MVRKALLALALLFAPLIAAAQNLPAPTTPLGDGNIVQCLQPGPAGAWKGCTLAQIKTYVGGAGGGLNIITTNPNIIPNLNLTVAGQIIDTTDNTGTNIGFPDNGPLLVTLNAADGQSIYGSGHGVVITQNKPTFFTLNTSINATAAGQIIGLTSTIHCEGMGDCFNETKTVLFGEATTTAGEGTGTSPSNEVEQDNFVPGSGETATSVVDQPCSAVFTQKVIGSPTVQTVAATVASGCAASTWATGDLAPPNSFWNEEGVFITASTSNSVTGIFRNNYSLATLTASASGTTLTVTALTAGEVVFPGQAILGAGLPGGLHVVGYGSGTGGTGTYTLNVSAGSISSEPMISSGRLTDAYLTTLPACNGYCGQYRNWIDISRPGYATGQAEINGSNLFQVSSGGAWTLTAAGGTVDRPGSISLAADDYSGSGFNGTSVDYYEVTAVPSGTTASFYKTDAAGSGGYQGLGLTPGTYRWFPSGRALVVGPTTASLGNLGSGQFVLDIAPGFVAGDTLIQPNSPYPDVTGSAPGVMMYSAGGLIRAVAQYARSQGRKPAQSAFVADAQQFFPSSAYPTTFTSGAFNCDSGAIQTCFNTNGSLFYGGGNIAGQTGYGIELHNVSGTGSQGGMLLAGFQGVDLTLNENRSANCLGTDSNGAVMSNLVGCTAGQPVTSISVGAAAGSGATAVCTSGHICDNNGGDVTLTTGTSPTSGTVFTVNFSATRTNSPNCVSVGHLTSSGAATTGFPVTTASTMAFSNPGSGLSGTYNFQYGCEGN